MKQLLIRYARPTAKSSFVHGFWNGLSGPAELYASHVYRIPVSDVSSLHGGWLAIGADINLVIARQNEQEATQTAAARAA